MAQTNREVENEVFATNLWQRQCAAVSSYFLFNGILVGMEDGAPKFPMVPAIVLRDGLYKKSQFKKKLRLTNEAVAKANTEPDQLFKHELIPRAAFLSSS